jgi:hypothetical protein
MKRFLAPFKRLGLTEPLAVGSVLVFLGGVAWIFPPAALIIGGCVGMAYAAFRESQP